jgi:hypothetical protein
MAELREHAAAQAALFQIGSEESEAVEPAFLAKKPWE